MAVGIDPAAPGPGALAPGPDPEELLARVQELSERAETLQDPLARELIAELLSAVIAMYGDGLERIMAVIAASREAGATIVDELTQDGAVASLLLIHDLYPVGLRDRVLEALETVRPYMESHGGDVKLVEITGKDVARLELVGSCHGCSASRATLETAIIRALNEHCPDLAGIDVGGVVDDSDPTQPTVSSITGTALPMAEGQLARAAAGLPSEPVCLPVIQSQAQSPAPPR